MEQQAGVATKRWTAIGLVVALFGIPAIAAIARLTGPGDPTVTTLRELAILALTVVLLLIVTKGERLPLSSIGLRFDRIGRSVFQGFILSIVLVLAAVGALAALAALGLPYGSGAKIAPSLALVTLTVIRAGIAEEIFFRGFALERIEALTGSKVAAVVITVAAFAGFHFSGGLAGVLLAFVLGLILTLYYVWKRDLLAAIVAHFLVDFVPNVVLPLLGGEG
ncbi:CPBP family intramembrane glutamic endopeptidase [Erythrobacter mangrovi]|uniref:CPBP family intramembrane metalloprotease n=1 Tax=Erythrobacter mangrovi TaxID=2739433 RepID=A0A7D3Y029_9SPHN|nr:type II CAAX endopeptidase family protein [Erythrobacter mangrovi]QKG71472.1 CPBP family intramembrane metalloprotease [Erythrobacter mangrovi]